MLSTNKRAKLNGSLENTLVLNEKWDKKVLRWLLARRSAFLDDEGNFDQAQYNTLSGIKRALNTDCTLTVQYRSAGGVASNNGRVFGKGFQSVPGSVRRLCSHKFYHDVDIVNCFPVVLDQLAQQLKIQAGEQLHRYAKHRDDILAADIESFQGVTPKQAKEQYLKVMFGGGKLDYETAFLLAFKADIEHITEHLWHLQQFRQIRSFVEFNKENQSNVKGSFISMVIQTVERKIANAAMQKSAELGYKPDVYVFDGFMVRRKEEGDTLPESYFNTLSVAVKAKTGYDVTFLEKSLQPTMKDSLRLRPSFNNFQFKNDWDAAEVFENIEHIARELNASPNSENVKKFCKRLIPIMNKAFAFVKGTVTVIAERVVKENDVFYVRSKIKAAVETYENMTFLIKESADKWKEICPMKIWRKSKYALTYTEIGFNPRPYSHAECAAPSMLNTFTGLSYSPTEIYSGERLKQIEENEMKPFLEHVGKIWCKSNEELYEYVINWLLTIIAKPWKRVEIAVVLQSLQGAGKGIIMDKIAEVIGKQYMSKPSSLDEIAGGSFNKLYFERCLLLFLDEAFYAGSKATKNAVKKIITDSDVIVNEKHLPSYVTERFTRMIIASNENHVINRDIRERRYLNLKLSNENAGNHQDGSEKQKYFNSIWRIDPQILCNYAHSVSPGDAWTGKGMPTTLEGELESIQSLSMHDKFIFDMIADPTLVQEARLEYCKTNPLLRDNFQMQEDTDPLEGLYVKSELHRLAHEYTKFKIGYEELYNLIKDSIKSVVDDPRKPRVLGKQQRLLRFPDLKQARVEYKAKAGIKHYQFD